MTRFRVGNGFDAHRLVQGRPLRLGGVHVPSDRGLEGHSDGDCAIHALCDALLGAAAAGDLGQHFPSGDPLWKGTDSLIFLEHVDVTVIAQAPALAPHLGLMREALARRLGLELEAVSVKVKSTDGLGALGRSEGIAAQATALLRGRD